MDSKENISQNTDMIVESDNEKLTFTLQSLDLNVITPRSQDVSFLVEKLPIEIAEGITYGSPAGVIIDNKSPKVEILRQQARELKELPEEQRLLPLMTLLRNNVKYSYTNTIDELEKTDQERAKWIMENIKGNKCITLSDLVEQGYGVCRHLSVLYLFLAKEAGLNGVLLRSDQSSPIKNILRTDSNQPLFKEVRVGEEAPPHLWLEIKLSSGKWVPIDPSTDLIGDTPDKLQMFNLANYTSPSSLGLDVESEPKLSDIAGLFNYTYFKPGEAITKASAYIIKHAGYSSPFKGDATLIISKRPFYKELRCKLRKIETTY